MCVFHDFPYPLPLVYVLYLFFLFVCSACLIFRLFEWNQIFSRHFTEEYDNIDFINVYITDINFCVSFSDLNSFSIYSNIYQTCFALFLLLFSFHYLFEEPKYHVIPSFLLRATMIPFVLCSFTYRSNFWAILSKFQNSSTLTHIILHNILMSSQYRLKRFDF